MDLRETWWKDVDWIHLAQDNNPWWTLVNKVMNLLSSMKGANLLDS